MSGLYLVRVGHSPRLAQALEQALVGLDVKELAAQKMVSEAAGKRLLFAAAVDAYGVVYLIGYGLMIFSTIMTVISGINYLYKNRAVLAEVEH